MKKVVLLIIFLTFTLYSKGQQIALSDTVSTNLPQGIEKLSRDEFASNIKSKFGQSAIALNSIPTLMKDNIISIIIKLEILL